MRTIVTYPTARRNGYRRLYESGYSGVPVDVRENEDGYLLDADLPGVAEEDVKLEIHDRHLTIAVETDSDEEKGIYLVRERRNRSFSRRLALPKDADSNNVSAVFENGVLSVTIPKSPEAKPRAIEVKRA